MSENIKNDIIKTFKRHDVCECGASDVKYYGSRCANNPDCYFKQLQRLKAQYNEIVEQNKGLQMARGEAEELIAELEKKITNNKSYKK